MKKHRGASDNDFIEMLRRRGAVIGPTAGERLAIVEQQLRAAHAPSLAAAQPAPQSLTRSSVRRFKSQTERRFAAHLDGLVAAGEILRWRYEAERLQLADHGQPSVTYTPDFVAWLLGGGRIFFEVKSKYHRDSDTETRRIFLWARQQFGDACHEFRAYRESAVDPGAFAVIWAADAETALDSIRPLC